MHEFHRNIYEHQKCNKKRNNRKIKEQYMNNINKNKNI